jgi:chemotaxis protein methyltransferase CheR
VSDLGGRSGVSAFSFEQIRRLLRQHAAIELGDDKHYLVNARLTELARELQLASAEAVAEALRRRPNDAELSRRVVESLTTNETFFFRDHHPFEALKRELGPTVLRAKQAQRPVRIWSAACSTGQEPYSLAMMQAEQFPDVRFKILATDLDTTALRRAQEGSYREHEVSRGLPEACLSRHFTRRGSAWQVNAPLKLSIEFRQLNLAGPWPTIGSFDAILVRNVLIYFSQTTKRDILERMAAALNPGGVLMLGAGESLVGIDLPLERYSVGSTSLYRHRNDRPSHAAAPG